MGNTHRAAKRRHNIAPGVSPGTNVALRSSPIGAKDSVTCIAPLALCFQARKDPGLTPGAWSLDISETLRPIERESTSTNLRFVPRWQTRTEPRSGATI